MKILKLFGINKDKNIIDIEQWWAEQIETATAGGEIKPPWIVFPNSSPIYGWNQGGNEYWKTNVWMPFWTAMSEDERESYLEKWQPPDEDWRETITVYWTGNRLS